MADNAQQQQIKRAIVDGYRRGVCTKDGGAIPLAKRGRCGKRSAFIFVNTEQYRRNFDRIKWSQP